MPDTPVTVYEIATGVPCIMHSVDAAEAVRLGHYAFSVPKGKQEDPEARSRAMARFMGGGLDQAELKSPEQREADTQRANEAEAVRTAPPVVVQVAPEEVQRARAASATPPAESSGTTGTTRRRSEG